MNFKQKYFPRNNGTRICVGFNIFQQNIDMVQHNLYYTHKCIQQLVIDLHLFFDSAFNFFYQILQGTRRQASESDGEEMEVVCF